MRPEVGAVGLLTGVAALALAAGCAGSEVPEPAYAAGELAPATACAEVHPFEDGSPGVATQLAPSGDTALVVLFGDVRLVSLIGPELRERWRLELSAEGPAGVRAPTGIALLDDTLLFVSDARRHAIRRLTLAGEDRGEIEVDFAPRQLAVTPRGIAAVRFLQPGSRDGLLTLIEEGSTRAAGPAPHPFASQRLSGLANTMALGSSRSGHVLLSHRTVVPRLYRVDPASGDFTTHPVVVPRSVRGSFRPLPRLERAERGVREVLIPAFEVAETPGGEVLYATGTGRWVDGSPEWALVRLSPDLEYTGGWRLPFTLEGMGVLASAGTVLIVDEAGGWHACPLET